MKGRYDSRIIQRLIILLESVCRDYRMGNDYWRFAWKFVSEHDVLHTKDWAPNRFAFAAIISHKIRCFEMATVEDDLPLPPKDEFEDGSDA